MEKIIVSEKQKIKVPFDVDKQQKAGKLPRGSELFKTPYCNIALLATIKSGKTTVIYNILDRCAGPHTRVIVFCPNWNIDKTYEKIRDMLDRKGISYTSHLDLMDGKESIIDQYLSEVQNQYGQGQPQEIKPTIDSKIEEMRIKMFGAGPKVEEPKPEPVKESKYIERDYIFIFDDMSQDLRNLKVEKLAKSIRHLKAMSIMSFHSVVDIRPSMRKQINYMLLFKGVPEDDLQVLRRQFSLSTSQEKFIEIYKLSTEKMFSFLYIDVRGAENIRYRVNFG